MSGLPADVINTIYKALGNIHDRARLRCIFGDLQKTRLDYVHEAMKDALARSRRRIEVHADNTIVVRLTSRCAVIVLPPCGSVVVGVPHATPHNTHIRQLLVDAKSVVLSNDGRFIVCQ